MKIIVSSDEYSPLVDAVTEDLAKRGHEATYIGPRFADPASDEHDWPVVTLSLIHI